MNKLVCQGQFGPITVTVPKASRSSVVFDLDNDGDLDIVTNDFNSEPQILVSDLAQVKKIHWLKVVLAGTKSNRNGLGATVRLRDTDTGDVDLYKLVGESTGNLMAEWVEVTVTSPMGEARMKTRVGDEVSYDAPRGKKRYKVLQIL